MVKESDLNVPLRGQTCTRGVVTWRWSLWINADHFPVTFVFKEQPRQTVCDHLIVGSGIGGGVVGVPVIEAQVGVTGQQLPSSGKVGPKIFSLV
jgi:hypothetical protein